jgi:hypothetical protein
MAPSNDNLAVEKMSSSLSEPEESFESEAFQVFLLFFLFVELFPSLLNKTG